MLAEERIAAAQLAADGFSELVGGVRDAHAAIAQRGLDLEGARPRHARHPFFAASLARDHEHRFGRFVGDLLVLHASAWGGWRRSERVPFAAGNYRHIGGATHFSLLNHPAVADQLVRWLASS